MKTTGRSSINPDLVIRMLVIDYCVAIRSERRLADAELRFLVLLCMQKDQTGSSTKSGMHKYNIRYGSRYHAAWQRRRS